MPSEEYKRAKIIIIVEQVRNCEMHMYIENYHTTYTTRCMSAKDIFDYAFEHKFPSKDKGLIYTTSPDIINHIGALMREGQIDREDVLILWRNIGQKEWHESSYNEKFQLTNWNFNFYVPHGKITFN